MQLVVAEKPSVARDLARVLGVRGRGEHAYESDAWVITWCIGHLVELEEPAAYADAWRAWRLDALPMLPEAFRLRPSSHAAPHLRAVAALLKEKRFAAVVNACDAGREGELIFRYVYQWAGARVPVRRLWISSLTDEAIRRGLAALRPGAQLDALGDAARCRSEADWLVGMNATRAVTVKNRFAGHTALYSIGRVQTPTLAMLVAREQQIRAFVPRDYWEVRGRFDDAFTAQWRDGATARLGSAAIAEAICDRDRPAQAIVEAVRARTVREAPPLLFDLTALQRTANRRFGFTAARTLELAQALYERHKVLTYPRTDSRHLTTDVAAELPALFAALANLPDYAAFAAPLVAAPPVPGKRVVDDTKVHDHHAIIPTGTTSHLDRDEQRLYDLVVRRFLGAFHGDAEFAVTEAWIRVGPPGPTPKFGDAGDAICEALPAMPDRYLARGRVRVAAGWQAVAGIEPKRDKEGDEEAAPLLPPLVEGQVLAGTYAPHAKQTTPPHRFTEATLLGAMESAGKAIDDEALRLAMKDCGLGTPATRAAVIETLLKRDYIARDKQSLVPTATGIGLIEALPVASLASPELTGQWEARLARIARGEESRAAFMADIARYVAELVGAIRRAKAAPPPAGQPPPQPREHRESPRADARTPAAPPARSAKTRAASPAKTASRVPKAAKRDEAGPLPCPRCAGEVIAGARGWGCSRWKAGCKFVVWFETCGRKLTATQLRELVTQGKTRKATWRNSRGDAVPGRLVLDPSAPGGAARLVPA